MAGLDISDVELWRHAVTLLRTYKKLQQAAPQINPSHWRLTDGRLKYIGCVWNWANPASSALLEASHDTGLNNLWSHCHLKLNSKWDSFRRVWYLTSFIFSIKAALYSVVNIQRVNYVSDISGLTFPQQIGVRMCPKLLLLLLLEFNPFTAGLCFGICSSVTIVVGYRLDIGRN